MLSSAVAGDIEGLVVQVHDGDTITMLDGERRRHKIRLNGIDAPELGQPFGHTAKQHLAGLLADRRVTAECHKSDRYGREVCVVQVGGADAGLEQLRAGMAWYFRRYASEMPPARRDQYDEIELLARSSRYGLWSDDKPMPPWEWRAGRR